MVASSIVGRYWKFGASACPMHRWLATSWSVVAVFATIRGEDAPVVARGLGVGIVADDRREKACWGSSAGGNASVSSVEWGDIGCFGDAECTVGRVERGLD